MISIVAHRGAPRHAHENTIESFLAAVSLGADMVELDIRRTGDNVFVIFHDPWLSWRTRNRPLSKLTYEELSKLTLKKGFSVPTMEEAFKTLEGKAMVDIELKEDGYEKEVIACARSHLAPDTFVLTSFNPKIIEAIKQCDPQLATGLIIGAAEALALCDSSPAEVIAPEKKLYTAHRDLFAKAKKRGKKIAVWTVDSTELLSRLLIDPAIDAIITNHPDKALAIRKKLTNK